ncbi:MAG: MGMT family protein [Halobacteriaceae archaeon]
MESTSGILARHYGALDCAVQVGLASQRVVSVSFPRSPPGDAVGDHPLLDRIGAYLDGDPTDFADVDVALTVPTDQREVIEAVRSVPYGESVTVETLAGMTPGRSRDSQDDLAAVRDALAANPVPLLIPDYRVEDGPGAAPAGVERRLRDVEGL